MGESRAAKRRPRGEEPTSCAERLADVAGKLGRRRYVVALGARAWLQAAGLEVELAAGQRPDRPPPAERAILLERSKLGLEAVGSLRLDWVAPDKAAGLELSGLSLPGDCWNGAGALTERNVLLLHAGIRRARRGGAGEVFFLSEPALLAALIRSCSLLRLDRSRPAPSGLAWAAATLLPGRRVTGFEAVLLEGAGLERLALFL